MGNMPVGFNLKFSVTVYAICGCKLWKPPWYTCTRTDQEVSNTFNCEFTQVFFISIPGVQLPFLYPSQGAMTCYKNKEISSHALFLLTPVCLLCTQWKWYFLVYTFALAVLFKHCYLQNKWLEITKTFFQTHLERIIPLIFIFNQRHSDHGILNTKIKFKN